jgi:hypothetical protein
LRGAPHIQASRPQSKPKPPPHRSQKEILVIRTILFLLILLTFFGNWGTWVAEPFYIYEDMVCTDVSYQGYCYYPVTGWQLFFGYPIFSCVFVWLALLLIGGGGDAFWLGGPSRLYNLALYLFFAGGTLMMGAEVVYSLFTGSQTLYLFWLLNWGGILATGLVIVALVVEFIDWRRARRAIIPSVL